MRLIVTNSSDRGSPRLVTIQESEHQIITAYEVHTKRPADVTLCTPALDRHQTIFGRASDLAAGDRGFSSATNEQAATTHGVPVKPSVLDDLRLLCIPRIRFFLKTLTLPASVDRVFADAILQHFVALHPARITLRSSCAAA